MRTLQKQPRSLIIPSKSRVVKTSRLEAGKACWKAQGYAEGIVE
jgi:hypothetical protein